MNEEVKEIFKTNKAYKLDDICKKIKTMSKEDIQKELNELEFNGFLIKENNKYRLFPKDYKLVNIRIDTNGNGFFYVNDDFYVIEEKNLNGALNGDLCTVNMFTGKVHSIVKRKSNLIICEVKDGNYIITNNNKNYLIEIENSNTKGLVDGNIILLRIKNYDKNTLKCNLVEVLGHINDPDIELKKIAIANNFNIDFSKDAIKQADSIKETVQEDELEGRLDLRDKLIYTIDDDHTKDMDDAISIEINDKGNYVIGVHIADVSHYIRPNTPLFNEAMQRGNSLYMLNTVIPMLMHKLSNGICSLNPNVDRLTISCIAEVDKNGNIVDYDIKKSVINSKKKMSYSDVNKILMDNEVVPGYEKFINNLKLANEASFTLNKNYKEHGYIQFGNNEIKYTGEEGNEFKNVEHRAAEKIIEDFMLLANKIVATNFEYVPFPFRVHETPDTDKIKSALNYLKNLGYNIPNINNIDNPKVLQGILKGLYESGDYSITSQYILKSLKKASYSPENDGHFGLGFNAYTHFTSPIRRFNDLLVHTIISNYLGKNFNTEEIEEINKNLYKMCEHISETEINADNAENEALKYKMAEFMEDKVDEYFNGKIVDIHPKYIIIKLENNIYGLAYINAIKNGGYYFDEHDYVIKSKNNKTAYKLGDYVRVKVIEADKDFRKINFRITENLNHLKNKIENEYIKHEMVEFMENKVGEYFNGKIIYVHSKYVIIKLENGICGLAHISTIKNGGYYFDEHDYVVKSKNNKITYKLGDYVRIKVVEVNKDFGKINFRITENLNNFKNKDSDENEKIKKLTRD